MRFVRRADLLRALRRIAPMAAAACAAALLLAGSQTISRAAAAADSGAARGVQLPVQQLTLKNGMRVVLSEDHSAPTLSLCMTYDVGSRNERPGRTGFAHLFEHLMFEGSQNVGKGEHMLLIENNGGDMNGTTTDDRTNYYERVPSNQLDLILFLESDRMAKLNVTQANLDNQRNAVQEERRLHYDNVPYGTTDEELEKLAYDNFSYKHDTIGSMADLNAASLEDVAAFYKTYYAPNNVVLTLVGDFTTAEATAKIKKYFEEIPAQPVAPAVDMTEPAQTAERRATITDAFARVPELTIAYKTVPANTPDWYALDMLGDTLFNGQSSRLYDKLVRDKQVAMQIAGGVDLRRGTSLFEAEARPRPGHDEAEIEKLIYEEIENVKANGVTQAELDRVRAQDRRTWIQAMTSTLTRAQEMGEFAVFFHDPTLVNTILDKYNSITSADLQRVAKKYLVETNRTVLVTNPMTPAQPGPGRAGQ